MGLLIALTFLLIEVGRRAMYWRPEPIVFSPYNARAGAFAISSDQRLLATGQVFRLSVRELPSGRETAMLSFRDSAGPDFIVLRLAFSHDKKMLAIARQEYFTVGLPSPPEVVLWRSGGKFQRMELTKNLLGAYEGACQLRFSADDKTIWLASTVNYRAWNVTSGRLFRESYHKAEWTEHYFPGYSALSPDFRTFYWAQNTSLSTWDIATGKRLARTKLPKLQNSAVVFDDSKPIIYYADTSAGAVWIARNMQTGNELWRTPHEVLLASNGIALCLGAGDFLEVRDAATGKYLRWLPMMPNSRPQAIQGDYIYSIRKDGLVFRQRFE
jgi:hypothetical protein